MSDSPLRGQLLRDEPLSGYTSWRVGGLASTLYKPSDLADLQVYLQQLDLSEPLLWLGLGSNTLVRDAGFAGNVIITQGAMQVITLLDETVIRAEAGVACATLARYCARQSLTGIEFLAGVPGTVGGALRMNAGCFNGETWGWVIGVEVINRQGEIEIRSADQFQVGYRQVDLKPDEWFVAGHFALREGDKKQSLVMIQSLLKKRADTQPTGAYSCGSVFRNPPGDSAGRLIERCGLKGYRIGGAMVSNKHANFILNEDQATAQEIEDLINHVARQVKLAQGVDLIREVNIVGAHQF